MIEEPSASVPWPNQQEVVDGVEPVEETSQDPNLFNEDDDVDTEMED